MEPPPQRTLMEKWKEHYHNRDFTIRPERASTAGVTFFWIFTSTLMYSSLFVLIPEIAKHHPEKRFWLQMIVWLIFVESVMNWVLTARRWVSQATCERVPQMQKHGASALPDGWRMCPTCQMMAPPRSHHCNLCKMCVLKRDHHCFFTGSCVGFNNQRTFVVFSFYIMAGSLYGVTLILYYLSDPLPLYKVDSLLTYVPFVALWQWVFGYLGTGLFLLLLQLYLCAITLVAGAGFFWWQIVIVAMGKTTFEATHQIGHYRLDSTWRHFRSVFGPFWVLNFIVPLPTLQEGDGVHWEPHKSTKIH